MIKISFWKGVLAWVKLSSLMFFAFSVVLLLPHLGFEDFNISRRFLSMKLFVMVAIAAYLIYVFSYGKFRLKRRGFLLAGLGHILSCLLFGFMFYPIVGFAMAVFYAIAAYKLAQTRIGCQCHHMA
ncbi:MULTISPECIES: hypothetical protein [Enterobacteriaceae]|uniref:hypothetical protein n=1 Tax=Enterobacteriaceae TaxID=543 RepID=UPI0015DC6D94|nr:MULTISPECIES: hypothetical protein [unclassified Klebsiella]BBS93617.1 hypothetical protein WP7S18C02_42320 [Klebsiella sp. WP7-S18-CRE-02]BBS98646.1 hypothetical protein WP7S18C03_42390 [Klebsiella sp. WP7-S18-CRE-03]BBT03713.1 hypothetical protein WP7S18E04_42750 [Klebsiella sp. WP7-S18-ESBL-04]HAT3953205.1 hypothetical protein [Kluyvera ascorbata]